MCRTRVWRRPVVVIPSLAMLLVAIGLSIFLCSRDSGRELKYSLEDDLAAMALLYECADRPASIELPDGSRWEIIHKAVKVPPGTVEMPQVFPIQRRVMAKATVDDIPRLMRLAKTRPRLTCMALNVVADIVGGAHKELFEIPRAGSADRDYWVQRSPAEIFIAILPEDMEKERDQALEAFETWLTENGYLTEGASEE